MVAAVATPMTRNGRVDPSVVESYGKQVVAGGAGALAVWAHTGRGLHLPEPTRETVLTAFRAATELPLIAGAGVPVESPATTPEAQVAATVTMAERAQAIGADAVMVFPCPAFRGSPQPGRAIVALHEAVAEAVEIPILGFFLHAEAGGYPYPRSALQDVLAMPSVTGLKIATLDSAIGCQNLISLVREAGKLPVTGEDRMFGPSLMWGAEAALVGIAAAAVPLSVAVTDAWFGGDAAAFLTASARLDEFAAATFHAPVNGYVQRMLWAAAWEGLVPGEHAHDRYGPPPAAADRDRVVAVLQRLRTEGGCS